MLSPIISTNSKGNSCRVRVNCSAVSYCILFPVPESPITAKRTEPFSRGNVSCCAAAAAETARHAHAMETPRSSEQTLAFSRLGGGFGERVRNEIDDQTRLCVLQDKISIDNAVLHSFRQFGKLPDQGGRDGRDGNSLR